MKRYPDAIAAHDPGGAEILAALVAEMHHRPLLALAGPAINVFERRFGEIESHPIAEVLSRMTSGQLLLTGTSVESPHELIALHGAHGRNIATASMLDSWINYEQRFSGRAGIDPVMPSEIWVGDFYAYAAAIRAGYLDRLRLVRNPLVPEIKARMTALRKERRSNADVLLLMLEPVAPLARILRPGDPEGLGFDEHKFLEQLLPLIESSPRRYDSIILRPHPRDQAGKYDAVIAQYPHLPIALSTESDFAADIATASTVIGMETIGLYYATLAGIESISFIPSDRFACRLPHSEIRRARSADHLSAILCSEAPSVKDPSGAARVVVTQEAPSRAVVIGLGKMGLGFDLTSNTKEVFSHTKAFLTHPRFELVGGADPDPARRAEFERFSGKPAFAEIEQLMNATRPNVVAVAVPTPFHAEAVHTVFPFNPSLIVLEKPIAGSFDESAALCGAAEERGITLYVNYMRSISPALLKVGQQIASGRFGAFRRGTISYWRGLLTNASHYINLLLGYLGDPSDIRFLQSYGPPSGLPSDRDIALELCFKGSPVMIVPLQNTSYGVGEVDLWFSEGRIRLLDFAERIEILEAEQTPKIRGVRRLYAALATQQPDMSRYQVDVLEHLCKSENSPRRLREELRRALLTVKICDAAIREADLEISGAKCPKKKCLL